MPCVPAALEQEAVLLAGLVVQRQLLLARLVVAIARGGRGPARLRGRPAADRSSRRPLGAGLLLPPPRGVVGAARLGEERLGRVRHMDEVLYPRRAALVRAEVGRVRVIKDRGNHRRGGQAVVEGGGAQLSRLRPREEVGRVGVHGHERLVGARELRRVDVGRLRDAVVSEVRRHLRRHLLARRAAHVADLEALRRRRVAGQRGRRLARVVDVEGGEQPRGRGRRGLLGRGRRGHVGMHRLGHPLLYGRGAGVRHGG